MYAFRDAAVATKWLLVRWINIKRWRSVFGSDSQMHEPSVSALIAADQSKEQGTRHYVNIQIW